MQPENRATAPPTSARAAALVAALAAGFASFAVYARTLAPTVDSGDGPELAAAALTLGVPHPTGYPLYSLLGHLWTRAIPLGDPAWRLNLLSAVCAALAVALLAASAARLARSVTAGWLAGGLLAFSPLLWSQATVVEVYALHLLLVVGALGAWLRFDADGDRRWLRLAALLGGLGMAHHLTTALLAPALVLGVFARHPRPDAREVARLVGLATAPLLLYAYLPLASARDPAVDWGNPETWHAFWYHVSGAQYRAFLGASDWLTSARQQLRELGAPLALFAPLALVGAHRLWVERPRALAVTALAAAAFEIHALSYGVVDAGAYALPAAAILALWTALGVQPIVDRVGRPATLWRFGAAAHPALVALLVAAPALPLVVHFTAQDRSRDFRARDASLGALGAAPAGGVLLTQGRTGYGVFYASLIEAVRPDVEVVDMFLRIRPRYRAPFELLRQRPPRDGVPRDLAVAAAAVADGRPVVLWPDVPDLDWASAGLYRVRGGVLDRLLPSPPDLRRGADGVWPSYVPLGDALAFGGARVRSAATPGSTVEVEYHWELRGAAPPDAQVVGLLARADGTLLPDANGRAVLRDAHPLGLGVPLDGYAPGERFRETVELLLSRDAPPGSWLLWVGVHQRERWLPAPGDRAFIPAAAIVVEEHAANGG